MSIDFNGTNQRIRSAGNYTAPTGPFSLSLWLILNDLTGTQRIFGTDSNWEIRSSGSQLLHEFWQAGTVPSGTISVSTWHHIVASYASSTTDLELWIDGVLAASKASNSPGSFTPDLLEIGNRTGAGGTEGMHGAVDEVKVFDRQLRPAEVMALHAGRVQAPVPGAVNHWPMIGGYPGETITGNVKDVVGGVDLAPINAPNWSSQRISYPRRAA